jgi:hypothetical protein
MFTYLKAYFERCALTTATSVHKHAGLIQNSVSKVALNIGSTTFGQAANAIDTVLKHIVDYALLALYHLFVQIQEE